MTSRKLSKMSRWTGPDFRVRMASDLVCPYCRRGLRPTGVRCEADALSLVCEHCHQDVVSVELSITEPVL